MGVQKQLLQKLGDSLVLKFRANIAPMKASGRTAASIHAVATDFELEVLANRSIGTTEYGRKPTSSGASKGNPTLFEQIQDWMTYKSAFSGLTQQEAKGVAYAITKKIHKEGWKTKLNKPLSSVTDALNYDVLLREVIINQAKEYESLVIKDLKAL